MHFICELHMLYYLCECIRILEKDINFVWFYLWMHTPYSLWIHICVIFFLNYTHRILREYTPYSLWIQSISHESRLEKSKMQSSDLENQNKDGYICRDGLICLFGSVVFIFVKLSHLKKARAICGSRYSNWELCGHPLCYSWYNLDTEKLKEVF